MICTFCERDLELPENAILLTAHHGTETYQFPDKQVHRFRTGKRRQYIRKIEPKPEPKCIVLPPKHKQEPVALVRPKLPKPETPRTFEPIELTEPDREWRSPKIGGSLASAFRKISTGE